MSQNRERILSGPVGPTLTSLTLPMVAGILSMIAFNLVDTFFIGQLGADQLAALSFTFPVILVVASLAMGVGVGVMSLVSKSIGENNRPKAAREMTDSLLVALVLVAIFSTLGLLTIDPLFRALGATEAILPYVREYMEIWYITILFIIIPLVGNNGIRATGDTKTPSYIMIFAVVINAILDPLLIFGYGPFPELGIRGAALATAISRAMTMVVAIYVLAVREQLITFKPVSRNSLWGCIAAILYIGLPAAGARMVNPIGIGILTRIIASFGPTAVAAFGVGTRVEMFALSVVNALASVIGPFVGQNLGARNYNRIREGFALSFRFSILWGLGMAALIALAARPVAGLFSDNPEVIRYTALFLYIVPVSYTLQGIFLVVTTSLNAMQRPLPAALLSLLQMFVLAVPLALLARPLDEIGLIFGALAAAYVLTGLAARWINAVTFERVAQKTDRLAADAG